MTNQTNILLDGFRIGDRVELAPHLDAWMAGDRYGEIEKGGLFFLHVRMDKIKKLLKVVPENLTRIE